MKIEVNVPKYLDLDHTYQVVMDAMYNSDNVSKQEVLIVSSILNQLAYNKSKSILKHGFRDWAETHHEMVCTMHALITNDTMPTRLLDIIDDEGMGGLYALGIDLTNEFCNTYENKEWNGDWVDTIIEFVNAKLK
jgi:hypothetical protein